MTPSTLEQPCRPLQAVAPFIYLAVFLLLGLWRLA